MFYIDCGHFLAIYHTLYISVWISDIDTCFFVVCFLALILDLDDHYIIKQHMVEETPEALGIAPEASIKKAEYTVSEIWAGDVFKSLVMDGS